LFAASGRPYLCRVLDILEVSIERYSRMGATLTTEFRSAQSEHHAIMDAFRAGDAERLGRLCREHRHNTRDRMLKHLDLAQGKE
jgi:DNA-binding GntR family transcriptional regulator